MNKELTAEEVESNWELFLKFSEKIGKFRSRDVLVKKMLDKYESRLVTCPASSRLSHHNAFTGGLVDHSLRVLKFALQLKKIIDIDSSDESIILTALFHDLGKIGDDTEDYYIQNDSAWHVEHQGAIYKYNEKLKFMPIAQRSLYLLQLNGIILTKDEFIAILIHDGQYVNENKVWSHKEPGLAVLLHQADYLATKREKGEI